MITIHKDCSVYCVSIPKLLTSELDSFYYDEGVTPMNQIGVVTGKTVMNSDMIPEIAGRLCYMSYNTPRPGGNSKYLEHILDVDHGSVLEHSNISFIFTGISRSLTHELVRHRAGMGYSQLSQRYVDESDVSIVIPPDRLSSFSEMMTNYREKNKGIVKWENFPFRWKSNLELAEASASFRNYGFNLPGIDADDVKWLLTIFETFQQYRQDVSDYMEKWKGKVEGTELRKTVRQMARAILPNCTETKIYVTGNIRAWRHILMMRGSKRADVEIRRLALKVLRVLKNIAPNCVQDLGEVSDVDGRGNEIRVIEKVRK